eukprot:1161883-Pelagomonas_calceolata.AAC.1
MHCNEHCIKRRNAVKGTLHWKVQYNHWINTFSEAVQWKEQHGVQGLRRPAERAPSPERSLSCLDREPWKYAWDRGALPKKRQVQRTAWSQSLTLICVFWHTAQSCLDQEPWKYAWAKGALPKKWQAQRAAWLQSLSASGRAQFERDEAEEQIYLGLIVRSDFSLIPILTDEFLKPTNTNT